jgi:chromosome segregation ATPase
MLAFIRNLAGVKVDHAAQGALEALVRWDPKSATEAELRTMEQHLDELGLQVAEARAAYDRERREAETIAGLSQQRMAAAEQLQGRLAAETDPARKAELERSLATLVGMLEEMAPEVDRERQDAHDALEFLETLEGTYAEAGRKLREARSELERAQRDMGRAAQQREAAQRRAEAARQAAGLTNTTSGLTVALKAMRESAARDLAQAEAANAKAKLLRPTQPEREDPNIAAAMASVSGAAPAPTALSDRLAALRLRQGGGAGDGQPHKQLLPPGR